MWLQDGGCGGEKHGDGGAVLVEFMGPVEYKPDTGY